MRPVRVPEGQTFRLPSGGEGNSWPATVALPPISVAFRDIQPAYLFASPAEGERSYCMDEDRDPNKGKLAVTIKAGEVNTVTLELTEEQLLAAERMMTSYTVVSRWERHEMDLDHRDDYRLTEGSYVVAALPIPEGASVSCPPDGETKVTLEAQENPQEDGSVWGGGSDNCVALRLPDIAALVSAYPADCRFLLSLFAGTGLSLPSTARPGPPD